MSLRTAARLARRELRGGLRGFRIFLACIILGVAAIALVGTIRESISAGLTAEGATLLGGDAEMEFTYRFANEAERAWMEETALEVSEIADFRSMATVPEGEAQPHAGQGRLMRPIRWWVRSRWRPTCRWRRPSAAQMACPAR